MQSLGVRAARGIGLAVMVISAWGCPDATSPSSNDNSSSTSNGGNTPIYFAISVPAGKWYGPGGMAATTLASPSQYVKNVRFTLERLVGPWALQSSGTTGLTFPTTDNCEGDLLNEYDDYICAAYVAAFGVEAESRAGNQSSASSFADTMNSSLESAYALCVFTGVPNFGISSLQTQLERNLTCSDLRTLLG